MDTDLAEEIERRHVWSTLLPSVGGHHLSGKLCAASPGPLQAAYLQVHIVPPRPRYMLCRYPIFPVTFALEAEPLTWLLAASRGRRLWDVSTPGARSLPPRRVVSSLSDTAPLEVVIVPPLHT